MRPVDCIEKLMKLCKSKEEFLDIVCSYLNMLKGNISEMRHMINSQLDELEDGLSSDEKEIEKMVGNLWDEKHAKK